MDYGYSILMLCLALGLLLYAGLIAQGGFFFIPKKRYVDPKDKRRYATQFAKVLALVAAAPAASGLVALIGVLISGSSDKVIIPAMMVLVIGLVICIYIGTRIMKDVM